MIKHTMKSKLENAKADEFYGFMIDPSPEVYAHWLPDEHHEFHVVKRGQQSPIGDLIYFDQRIGGKYRLSFHAVTRFADKHSRILFQMRKFGINLPGFLELKFKDSTEGLLLKEEIRIGFNGLGKILDPFIRIFFNKAFFREMNGHHQREWRNLADIMMGIE